MLNNIKSKISGYFDTKDTPDKDQQDRTNNEPELNGDISEQLWKEDIISMVKTEFERRRQERLPFELQWRLNMNFLNGNQYCDINQYSMTIMEQDKLAYWQQREVFNHLAPIVETRLAKLGRLRPAMTVLPATSDEEDINTAKVCKSIVSSTYRKLNMRDKISNANAWSEICGSVFYKSVWNPTGGRLVAYMEDKTPLYEGDIDVYVTPAYELFPDNNYNDGPDRCRSIIHAKAYSVDDIYDIWGIRIKGTDVDIYSLGLTSISTGGLGYNATIPTVAPTVQHDAATVLEYYEKPSRNYPNGRLIIVAQDELLHYGPLPYINGEDKKRELPFKRQNCTDKPGCFWGVAVIERCIPIQRAYNAVKNRKHDFLNRAAIGVWTYEEGSIEDKEDDLKEDGMAPGTILPRKKGSAPPSQVENGNLPPDFRDEEEKLEKEFDLISGVSAISRSSTAPTGASGISLEILKEQDDTRISLTAENIRQAIVQVCKQWLRLYKQFASGPRMDRLVGKSQDVFVQQWTANDITSDDVVPETEDDLAQTPAQRKQSVYDLLQAGLLVDPDTGHMSRSDKAKVMEMLNFGNWQSADDMDQLQITGAQKENLDIQKNIPLRVRDFDDHELHIMEHNKFRLSADYSDLEHERPDKAKEFDIHVETHQKAIQMMQQQAMQAQAAAQPKQEPKTPGETISFKDLPISGKIQMAQQAGIELNPQEMLQLEAENKAQQQAMNQAKMQKLTESKDKPEEKVKKETKPKK